MTIEPRPTPTVYLRGTGHTDEVWERVERAMWDRGWVTVRVHTTAWHLARGGVPVVAVNFSRICNWHTVERVRAKYEEQPTGDSELALVRVSGGNHRPALRDRKLDEQVLADLVDAQLVG